jgi:hypothetical protein
MSRVENISAEQADTRFAGGAAAPSRAPADLAVIQKAGLPGRLPVAVDEGIIRHLRLVRHLYATRCQKASKLSKQRSGLPYEHPIRLRAPP